MRNLAISLVCGASMVVTSCGPILREVRYPGGYPGYILDKRTFDASGDKTLQLLRASILIAMAARIGEANVDSEDADAFAAQISDAAMELNHAAFTLGYGDNLVASPASALTVSDGAGHVLSTEEIDKRKERGSLYACSTAGVRLTADTSAIVSRYDEDELEKRNDTADSAWGKAAKAADYAKCGDYFVNFEASISRIEARVVRAMLTAISTDQARKFLDKVGEGDVLGAVFSLLRVAGSVGGSFHRGAGVYRSGVEALVAGIKGDNCKSNATSKRTFERYNEWNGHTLDAATCLGLDPDNLFEGDEIDPDNLAHKVRPGAFHAMMLITRQSCVGLPLDNLNEADQLKESRRKRKEACDAIVFDPVPRNLAIDPLSDDNQEAPTAAGRG